MQVRISGLLKLRSAAAVNEALQVFDRESFPEFFTADIWEPVGRFLRCQTEFEIAADCDASSAVRAIVACAMDGVVEVHVEGDAKAYRFARNKRRETAVGEALPKAKFGAASKALARDWSDALDKERRANAAKSAAKTAKTKPASMRVKLGGDARDLIAVGSGGFAAVVQSELVLFGTDGVVTARIELGLPGKKGDTFRAQGLTELLDGRIAVECQFSGRICVVDPRERSVAQMNVEGGSADKSVVPVPGGFVCSRGGPRKSLQVSLVLGDQVIELDPGTAKDEFPKKAVRWGDRFVVGAADKNLVYDHQGTLLFETEGGDVTVFRDRMYSSWEGRRGRTEADGSFTKSTLRTLGVLTPIGDALLHTTNIVRRIDAHENVVWSARELYGHTFSGPPIVLTDSVIVLTPASYPGAARLVVVDFETGTALGEISGQGAIKRTYRVNDDTVVGLERGALGKKLHVFRNLREVPRYEALDGHSKPIADLAIQGNVIVTRSEEDGTTRLFDLS